ncbi:tRNA (adenosine(37)-N6)-threonylcarbamoyltransferase complex dimerization subunit type 1 TsaB [Brevundimonas sp. 2R-24]|uniref:N(6)-L-threonylcarbamoyladenine synthase n=1 Tax=Peiella sedimenti TaxID=3061083 RepID=A0ABT8SL59_9CAUL|nr:tRNA (adenosine(37)-N6)-threonylcarbamoyltransferase complex dimerization subunit type 1 TsaB [Caulobacteraceae bacterium XZ-24]
MKLLAIDTALSACTAVVLADGRLAAVRTEEMARGHQERLAPLVQEVMAEWGEGFTQLDRIGVTLGPGSFTGLRVGLAFAKGLALALDRPLVGVGTLEALAATAGFEGRLATVLPSRDGAAIQGFDGEAPPLGPPRWANWDEAEALCRDWRIEHLAGEAPGGFAGLPFQPVRAPDPEALARLVARTHPGGVTPIYLRPPDAKLPQAKARP